jgi:hypothetical protein
MDSASEAILALKPVTFQYKKAQQFGLVAEEVAAVNPGLVEAVNARLKKQAAQIEKVSAQLETTKSAPQVASPPAVALREGRNNQ